MPSICIKEVKGYTVRVQIMFSQLKTQLAYRLEHKTATTANFKGHHRITPTSPIFSGFHFHRSERGTEVTAQGLGMYQTQGTHVGE